MPKSKPLTLKFTEPDDLAQVQAFLAEKGFMLDTPTKRTLAIHIADGEEATYRPWLGRILPGFTLAGDVEVLP